MSSSEPVAGQTQAGYGSTQAHTQTLMAVKTKTAISDNNENGDLRQRRKRRSPTMFPPRARPSLRFHPPTASHRFHPPTAFLLPFPLRFFLLFFSLIFLLFLFFFTLIIRCFSFILVLCNMLMWHHINGLHKNHLLCKLCIQVILNDGASPFFNTQQYFE
jgi:hypothetical protein